LTEHLTQNQIEQYGRQKLPAAELLSVSDHLSGCESCRRLAERALDADAVFFALQSEVSGQTARTHPSLEETAGYVDGTLDGEEMQAVTDHLTRCERCALAVDDLRAFRTQVAPGLNREYQPAIVAAPAESWWRGLSLLRPPALAFGSALIVLLLAGTGWLIRHTLQNNETKETTAATTSSPAVSTAASVIAEVNDGGRRVLLDQEGKLSGADDLPPDYQLMVKEALTRQRLEKSPLLAGLSRPASSLMGSDKQGQSFSVIEPVGKILMSDRPTFGWSPLDGAAGYVVEVYDEKFSLVAAGPQLTAVSWIPPQPLARGGIYSWQVKAIKDGQEVSSPRPPAPQAKFRILDQAKANELAQAERTYASSHLTLGLLYAQTGLLDEAEREFRALQEANPNSAPVRQLLESVQAMRR